MHLGLVEARADAQLRLWREQGHGDIRAPVPVEQAHGAQRAPYPGETATDNQNALFHLVLLAWALGV